MGFPAIMKDAYETVMFDDERRAVQRKTRLVMPHKGWQDACGTKSTHKQPSGGGSQLLFYSLSECMACQLQI